MQLVWVPGETQQGPLRETKRRESSGLFAAAVEVPLLWARLSKGPSHVRETERRALRARLSKGPHEREPERREGSQDWLR